MQEPISHKITPVLTTHSAVMRGLKTSWLESAVSETAENQSADTPILMMLHGFPDSPQCWDMQFEPLGSLCHVVAPWVRGAGGSEAAKEVSRYGSDAVVLDHLQILQRVDPQEKRKIILIGHDLGGLHAINLARALSDRCAGIVIINSLDLAQMARRLLSNPKQILKSWYFGVLQIPLLPEKLLGRFEKRFLSRARTIGGLPIAARPEFSGSLGNVTAPLNQYRAFFRELPTSGLFTRPKLKIPTLILWGRDDAFLTPPTQDEMELLSEKPIVRILKGNHWLHRENAETVNDLLKNFIQGLDLK